ncbi:MAG: Lrp/AsnC family transcriptional regulator [Candidatus Hermodarchaeota archaeon]|nr:Lrp/AsnC family transcriptional regulator [Candidatus Hermodarchaeota archaeon]
MLELLYTTTMLKKGLSYATHTLPLGVWPKLELVDRVVRLTERQLEILRKLYQASVPMSVQTVTRTQKRLAKELGITRQALSNHLRKLRGLTLIRTGRGFIDLSPDALRLLGKSTDEALVFLRVEPKFRVEVYEKIIMLQPLRLHRVTGSVDMVVAVSGAELAEFLSKAAEIDGVIETSTHTVLTTWTPEAL